MAFLFYNILRLHEIFHAELPFSLRITIEAIISGDNAFSSTFQTKKIEIPVSSRRVKIILAWSRLPEIL